MSAMSRPAWALNHAMLAYVEALERDAARYRFLRNQIINEDMMPPKGGVFIGLVPQNLVLTHEHADQWIDDAMQSATGGQDGSAASGKNFLLGGTRMKLSFNEVQCDECGAVLPERVCVPIDQYAADLQGQWVALVDATNNRHLNNGGES